MQKKRLLIYGANGQGREILSVAWAVQRNTHTWDEILFVDDGFEQDSMMGVPVLPFDRYLEQQADGDECIIAAADPSARQTIMDHLQKIYCPLTSVLSPDFRQKPFQTIGNGVFISENVTIAEWVCLGDCACINPSVTISHECQIESHVTIAPGSVLCGGVTVGEGTFIGAGVTIRNDVTIGKNCIIGMGSLVTKDLPDNVVAAGSPCKVIRENAM